MGGHVLRFQSDVGLRVQHWDVLLYGGFPCLLLCSCIVSGCVSVMGTLSSSASPLTPVSETHEVARSIVLQEWVSGEVTPKKIG